MGRYKVTFGNIFSQGAGRTREGPHCVLLWSVSLIPPSTLSYPNFSLLPILHFFTDFFGRSVLLLPSLSKTICCGSQLCCHFLQAAFLTPWRLVGPYLSSRVILQITWENVHAVLAFLTELLWAAILWGRVVGAHTVLEFSVEETHIL